eukprot:4020303-Prymnesium_polylepis.2
MVWETQERARALALCMVWETQGLLTTCAAAAPTTHTETHMQMRNSCAACGAGAAAGPTYPLGPCFLTGYRSHSARTSLNIGLRMSQSSEPTRSLCARDMGGRPTVR